jgi:hypothetical protein
MVFKIGFVQVDKINGQFFSILFRSILIVILLHCQSEAETSSAGEQLVRNNFDSGK